MRSLLLGLALAAFLLHAACFAGWLVDDAGISLAYARNLGQGYGLRSQPGAAAVEGFSNPLWTLLLVIPSLLGEDLRLPALKTLSVSLVALSFALMTSCRIGREAGSAFALVPIALSPSFVIWTTSGLENPLFALLGVASVLCVEDAAAGRATAAPSAGAGLVAAALALTRPDGLAYAPAFLLGLAFQAFQTGAWPVRSAVLYVASLATVCGGYLAFRWSYFGDFVPNTYRASFVTSLADHDPRRLVALASSVAGPLALLFVVGIVAALLLLARRGLLAPLSASLSLHLVIASTVYLILPPDWMGEFRFATLYVVFFWWLVFDLWDQLASPRFFPDSAGGVPALGAGLLACLSVVPTLERSWSFAKNPTVPLARISDFGRAYESLAREMPQPSLLTPDLGGVLLTAERLRVHDLAGLCDREVAKTLMRDTPAFHDYVFERLRPTFIHVHGTWAETAALHADPRFARDYVPLHERWSRPEAQPSISGHERVEPWTADYIRLSAVPAPSDLASVRSAFFRLGLAAKLP